MLSGRFVNSAEIHCADERFWEVRAPNYFGCWIYLCWVKRRCGVHGIEPKPRFLIISAFQYLPPVKMMGQYLNGNYLGEI